MWCLFLSCSKGCVMSHVASSFFHGWDVVVATLLCNSTVRSQHHWANVGMLRDRFMTRRTSTLGRLSCFVWPHPSSATAMWRSKRKDTDFFLSLGFPWKKDPSHCRITLSIFSVLDGTHTRFYTPAIPLQRIKRERELTLLFRDPQHFLWQRFLLESPEF